MHGKIYSGLLPYWFDSATADRQFSGAEAILIVILRKEL